MKAFALAHPVIVTLMALSVLGTIGYSVAAFTYKGRQ